MFLFQNRFVHIRVRNLWRVAAHLYHPKGGGDHEKGGGFGSGPDGPVHWIRRSNARRSDRDLETRNLFIGCEVSQEAYTDEEID